MSRAGANAPPPLRRVVVTGLGVVSCIGNDLASVETALRRSVSGIRTISEYAELGFRSRVAGVPDLASLPPIDRKVRRFMGDAALQAFHAANAAIADAALPAALLASERTGLILGTGTGSLRAHTEAVAVLRERGISRVPPYNVPRVMASTASANLSTAFGIRGTSYSIASACTSSAHGIGHAAELVQWGKQDVVIAGGAEEVCWTSTLHFDAMGALSTGPNDPTASRPYDTTRDGFVIAGGAGMLVLEELEHARQRGARIYAELSGYGASSDGVDMVLPTAEGAARAMRRALAEALARTGRGVDYINTHGTSTVAGDIAELRAIRDVFGDALPPMSSTKGITGHALAASAAQEAVYSLLMLDRGFLAGCAHLGDIDPAARGFPLLRESVQRQVDSVMSNSFGFGGTNASLVFSRLA